MEQDLFVLYSVFFVTYISSSLSLCPPYVDFCFARSCPSMASRKHAPRPSPRPPPIWDKLSLLVVSAQYQCERVTIGICRTLCHGQPAPLLLASCYHVDVQVCVNFASCKCSCCAFSSVANSFSRGCSFSEEAFLDLVIFLITNLNRL